MASGLADTPQVGVASGALPALAGLRAAGTIALSVAACCAFTVLVGLFGQFSNRALVVGVLDIGHTLMLAIALGGGVALARRVPTAATVAVAGGLLVGLAAAAGATNLRWMLVSLTPVTLNRIGFGLPGPQAALLLAVAGAAAPGWERRSWYAAG